MSVTATSSTDFMGDLITTYKYAESIAGLPDPAPGQVYRRGKAVMSMYRFHNAVTAFNPQAGTTTAGNNLSVKNGANTLTGNASYTYTCELDELSPEGTVGAAISRENLVWVAFTQWALVTPPYYTP